MRTIAVATVARSDWGLYVPVLNLLREQPGVRIHVIAAGTHLSAAFGETRSEIEEDGFEIGDRVETVEDEDSPAAISRAMSRGTAGFAAVYERVQPDLLLVLGDRFEMHSAVVAAVPFRIPVAHIQGGELSFGAIDDQFRHSITKMAHLHFPATELYGKRIVQLGEEPWRVTVSGAPAIDNIRQRPAIAREELAARHGLRLDGAGAALLVTYHPVTLEYDRTDEQMTALLDALAEVGHEAVITYPNTDTRGRRIIAMIEDYGRRHDNVRLVVNLGSQGYLSMMRYVDAAVGNSSSGIIEAASFELPVVNIGTRQDGRLRAENVIDTGYGRDEIVAGIERALSPEFREGLDGLVNPYGDGHAAERIVERLTTVELDQNLIVKRFHDLDGEYSRAGDER